MSRNEDLVRFFDEKTKVCEDSTAIITVFSYLGSHRIDA
jgi:hypothetical protein